MTRRIDLNDIRLLMEVVEHGSYTAAARAIGVPKLRNPLISRDCNQSLDCA